MRGRGEGWARGKQGQGGELGKVVEQASRV